MALAATAAVAGTAAAAAYLDAKFHIQKDITSMYNMQHVEKRITELQHKDQVSLWYIFEEQIARLPALEPYIWSRNGKYTAREVHAQSTRYAQFLRSSGVRPGQLCAFYLTNSPEFMFATMGSWAVESAPALINYNLAGDALVHCLRISGAGVVLVDWEDECRARIEEVRERVEGELGMRIVVLDRETRETINGLRAEGFGTYRPRVKPDFPLCLMYTSGSTGMPKAVPFPSHRGLLLESPRITTIGLKGGPNGDRWYDCMPLYHGTGFTVAVSCMVGGIVLCIGKKFSTSKFWDDIRASDATAFVYVGETARYLLAAPPSPLDKQHRVRVMFGNGLRPDVWTRFQDRFGIQTVCEFFNSTEGVFALMNISRGPFFASAVGHHGAIMRWFMHSTYVPVKVELETDRVWRDPRTGFAQRCAYEEGGEILVKIPTEAMFPGYWGNEKATRDKYERDVFQKGDLWYRTSDALRRDNEGRWYFMDRLGDTFRWKSENVSTAEVAETLGRFSGVQEAALYGVQVPAHDGKAGCAAINIEGGKLPDEAYLGELLAYARKRLPKYAVPVFLRVKRELKGMHNNKQDKGPLRKQAIDLDQIYGKGRDVQEIIADGKTDVMYWWPGALEQRMSGDRYVEFSRADWERLKAQAPGGEVSSKL